MGHRHTTPIEILINLPNQTGFSLPPSASTFATLYREKPALTDLPASSIPFDAPLT